MAVESSPNVLFLMVDQMQGEAIKSPACLTPNFDKLISRGICFDKAYTPNPVCSPARASLMTGLMPHNHGVVHVIHLVDDDQSCIREDKPHWAQRLRDAGYNTGYVGKWHVERTHDLKKYGWDISVSEAAEKPGLIKSRYIKDMQGYAHSLLYGVTDVEPEDRPMGIHVKHGLDILEDFAQKDEPWCLFVSTNEPHDPFVCGSRAYEKYDAQNMGLKENFYDDLSGKPNLYKKAARVFNDLTEDEKKEAIACYYASITEIDQQYGKLISKVQELGLAEDTIIVFTSDHGEFLGAHGLYQKNISAFEEAYNIPMIMAGPGIAGRGHSDARVGLHDLCQTLLELTGCETIKTNDSRSFAGLLDTPDAVPEEWTRGFAEYFGGRMLLTQRVVWDGDYKYVFNGFDEDEFYDLEKDPYEMVNLISSHEHAEAIKHMVKLMWKYVKKTGDHSLERTHYASLRLAPYGSLIK